MYRLYECLTQEHDLWLLSVAALVCVAGSSLTIMTLRRLIGASGRRKRIQLVMSSLITGATIWSTHFIAMLAYDPVVEHGYDPLLTGASLGVAVLGAFLSNASVAYRQGYTQFILAGSAFGLTVSIMHYVGMSSYLLPGKIIWNEWPVAASVLLGMGLGIASYDRVLRPITRFCWLAGAVLMLLSIYATHFTAMSAFEIRLNPTQDVPPQVLSDSVVGLLIFAIVALVLFIGYTAISIETNLERESIRKLEHAVAHDYLTGLPNRLKLAQKLDDIEILLQSDPLFDVAVVAIDINNFKYVNDVHGHTFGDAVLSTLAKRLQDNLRDGEFLACIGGDQFVALLTKLETTKDAREFANNVCGLIAERVDGESSAITLTASVGIATSLLDGRSADTLMRKSDYALFRAKDEFDLQICEYDAVFDQQIREKIALTEDLRFALAKDQFSLVYQLQNETGSRKPIGCEALLRWHHPTRGLISPVTFIPLAEESGQIKDIGRWVMRAACFEAASWVQPWSIAVNVAPQQLLQPNFLDDVADILRESGLDPNRLEVELTEASVNHDQASTLKTLKAIKEMGIRIAMDDFGTGYSSLATLQNFPFDKIKIDRSFITDLHKNKKRGAIVRSTMLLAKAFDMSVLAEGVETLDELNFLKAEGCNFVQGYFFGKPMVTDAIRELTMAEDISIAS